jgi:hypothetical protein
VPRVELDGVDQAVAGGLDVAQRDRVGPADDQHLDRLADVLGGLGRVGGRPPAAALLCLRRMRGRRGPIAGRLVPAR